MRRQRSEERVPPTRYLKLPPRYRILPAETDQLIPGFESHFRPWHKVLSPRHRDCREWFDEFVGKVRGAIGKHYLPVCRLSDGEYTFMFGEQPPDERLPFWQKLISRAKQSLRVSKRDRQFNAFTLDLYHSGTYTNAEQQQVRQEYTRWLKRVAQRGVLALHLTFGGAPFQERFHPAVGHWLVDNGIEISDDNYYPFYFVYALVTGPRRREVLAGRRVLVVNGSDPQRHAAITAGLHREGVAEVGWCPISERRSLFDRIDPTPYFGKYDLAVVGAGIGKPNVLVQLEPLQIPCIDVGFVFAVWQHPANGRLRPYCAIYS
jgi:hypothetical protein